MLAGVAACGVPEAAGPGQINDPNEADNRTVHKFNLAVDRTVIRPVAVGYTTVVPRGIRDNVLNFAGNLRVPSSVINQTLQGDLLGAGRNVLRFGINSTLGLAGLADVASGLGLEEQNADFGQTLAFWGVAQGPYAVVPFFGPTTRRDTIGLMVDIVINPVSGRLYPNPALPPPYDLYATVSRVFAGLDPRGRFIDTIDSVLYDSVDSYTATRDIYLQTRAFELEQLGIVVDTDDVDPYADIFGD